MWLVKNKLDKADVLHVFQKSLGKKKCAMIMAQSYKKFRHLFRRLTPLTWLS